MFKGFGRLKENYIIKLQSNCQPHALTTPRQMAIPLLLRVEAELKGMQQPPVIKHVKRPTD